MLTRRRFVLAAGMLAAGCGGGSEGSRPAQARRTDILVGYYGAIAGQAKEVADHTNLYLSDPWGGPEVAAADIKDARDRGIRNIVVMVDADKGGVDETTSYAWAWLFELRRLGALDGVTVKALYWRDEPNLEVPEAGLQILSDARVRAQNASLRAMLAKDFPDLGSVGMWTIMADKPDFPGLDDWDAVGLDDYPRGCGVLAGKSLERLRAGAKRTLLVPSPLFETMPDPSCIEDFAHANSDVLAVIPFLWRDGWGPQRLNGIRSHPARAAYVAMGKRLTGK